MCRVDDIINISQECDSDINNREIMNMNNFYYLNPLLFLHYINEK